MIFFFLQSPKFSFFLSLLPSNICLLLTVKLEMNLYFFSIKFSYNRERRIEREGRERRFDFSNRLNRLSVVYWARVISDYTSNIILFLTTIYSAFFVFLCLLSHLFIGNIHYIYIFLYATHALIVTICASIWKRSRKYIYDITFGFSTSSSSFFMKQFALWLEIRMECIIIIFTYHFSSLSLTLRAKKLLDSSLVANVSNEEIDYESFTQFRFIQLIFFHINGDSSISSVKCVIVKFISYMRKKKNAIKRSYHDLA